MDEVVSTAAETAAAVDLTELLAKLDTLISLSTSIYSWLALALTLGIGGFVLWLMFRPLWYFFR